MNKIQKVLTQYGLSDNEIAIYTASLREHGLTPYKISKLTGIPRTTVYDTLLSLALKKLIELDQSDGYKKQQTLVRAKNPSTLRSLLREKKEKLDELEIDVIDILPDLAKETVQFETNSDFSFYPGIDGFKKIYLNDEIVPEISWNPLIASDIPGRDDNRKTVDRVSKRAAKINTPTREIIPLTKWTKHVLSSQFARDENYLNRNFRYIEGGGFDVNSYIALTKDRIAMCTSSDGEAWGLVIKSPALYSTLRASFEVMWNSAIPVTKELVKEIGADDLYKGARRKGKTL